MAVIYYILALDVSQLQTCSDIFFCDSESAAQIRLCRALSKALEGSGAAQRSEIKNKDWSPNQKRNKLLYSLLVQLFHWGNPACRVPGNWLNLKFFPASQPQLKLNSPASFEPKIRVVWALLLYFRVSIFTLEINLVLITVPKSLSTKSSHQSYSQQKFSLPVIKMLPLQLKWLESTV